MRNLLALIGFVIVVFAAVGYQRGWYSLSVSPGSDGKTHITGDIDTKKIKDDGSKVLEKGGEAAENLRNKNPGSAAPAPPATTPVPTK